MKSTKLNPLGAAQFLGMMQKPKLTGKTGEHCHQSGDYKCSIHESQIIPISKPEIFPPCNSKGNPSHAAEWVLIKAR